MKLLHSADWHLGAPLQSRSEALRQALPQVPTKVVALAQAQRCDLLLLAGDIFDSPTPPPEAVEALREALRQAQMPVFIAPGNHDHVGLGSPWLDTAWPENVRIFTREEIGSVGIPALSCRIYGAGFRDIYCDALLEGFRAQCPEKWAIGLFHGDPIQVQSQKNSVTQAQVRASGLSYLALGHVHQGGAFRAGDTLCAWPGCPMGRGFDETGDKGVLLVTLEDTCTAKFLPLDGPRFRWHKLEAGADALTALQSILPPTPSGDFFRIELTGESQPLDLQILAAAFPHIPNLELVDRTVPPLDLWQNAGEDSLEGVYFGLLQQAAQTQPELATLAARISRQVLLGREVELP